MSKKHYIKIAAMFNAHRQALTNYPEFTDKERKAACAVVHDLAWGFSDIARFDNPNFDRARFMAACGFED